MLLGTNLLKVCRNFPSRRMSVLATSLKYEGYGEPAVVVKIFKEQVDDPKDDEVLVKILAAPINPSDINTIQGKYPVKPTFPATGGNECVGEVVSIAQNVKNIKVGDRVIPFATGLGTWTSYAKYKEANVLKVPKELQIPEASTIIVNTCTAYRMLKDFTHLKEGDTIIQNGANSAVGQAVHQICKAWKINSIGVVRDRPEIEDLRNYLKSLGANEVLTEEELRKTGIFKGKFSKPKLAFNCVGGKSATEITRHLDNNGVLITYGGMSREPVVAATSALIFKDISFRGFWMTRWTKDNFTSTARSEMYNDIINLMLSGNLKAPVHEMVSVNNYQKALEAAVSFKGFTGKKFILDFTTV